MPSPQKVPSDTALVLPLQSREWPLMPISLSCLYPLLSPQDFLQPVLWAIDYRYLYIRCPELQRHLGRWGVLRAITVLCHQITPRGWVLGLRKEPSGCGLKTQVPVRGNSRAKLRSKLNAAPGHSATFRTTWQAGSTRLPAFN